MSVEDGYAPYERAVYPRVRFLFRDSVWRRLRRSCAFLRLSRRVLLPLGVRRKERDNIENGRASMTETRPFNV